MVIEFNKKTGVQDKGIIGKYYVLFSNNLKREYRITPKEIVTNDEGAAIGLNDTYLFPLLKRGEFHADDFIIPKHALPNLKKLLLQDVVHEIFHKDINRKQCRQFTVDYYNSQVASSEWISNKYGL